jgi:putative ABC transport system permease protein
MLMSNGKKQKDIGTLKAVGWTKSNIIIMILLESLFIGVIGSILGIILGIYN